jgi:Zn-dependent peptidase ImmA (M78 family)
MSADYRALKLLAHQKRKQFSLTTKTINLNTVRAIYRAEGIAIDQWKLSSRIRAVYMCDHNDASVLINEALPKEPKLFTLVHELKHHYADQEILTDGQIPCGDYNANRDIEVGAEVFAAEFIYPEEEFVALAKQLGLTGREVTAEDIVTFKRAVPASVSYQFLRKRFEFLNLAPRGKFAKIKFTLLEEQLYGAPIYKQSWFRQLRANRSRNRRQAS